jgi:antitoxin component of RelBE/YafQ-DinJ toxin-antitoxin module
MQTTVIFKTDKKLKEAAQRTAKKIGIPFSAVLNGYMKQFIEEQEITLSAKPLTYRDMAADEAREKEAREWSENLLQDLPSQV